MDIESYRSIKINDEITVQVNESARKLAIMAVGSGFGQQHIVLTFEEFQQVVNVIQVLALERTVTKEPEK